MLSALVGCLLGCAHIELDLSPLAPNEVGRATLAAASVGVLPQSVAIVATTSRTALVPITATPLPTGPTRLPDGSKATAAPPPTHEALASLTPTTTPAPTIAPTANPITHIGDSAGGRPIHSYHLGHGAIDIVVVGGMHGGYEWNTIVLAEEFLSHFQTHAADIPPAITLHIVPNANPDGLALVDDAAIGDGTTAGIQSTGVISDTLAGRFNANGVDLNRNWDCLWTEQGQWRDQTVSAGTYPFSEPETASLSRFFLETDPALVIFLHSVADAVYVSGCPEPDPASAELAVIYGLAAGYPVYPVFNHYKITGDAGDWLTTQGIPSFTVELSSRETIDWEQNLRGLTAILVRYSAETDLQGAE